jgi:5'-methylthioinosine phosphorylase
MSNELIAIIGGTGLTEYYGLNIIKTLIVKTSLGPLASPLVFGTLHGKNIVFLARHGQPHAVPPHKVNYRANILALKEAGVTQIIAVNAVGGITENMVANAICIPDQIIDYTHGRLDTFFDGEYKPLDHIDFSHPYDFELSEALYAASKAGNVLVEKGGVYGATQGPRLETVAEIKRMEQDGCDIVGMTGMPEAVLARELNIPYSCVSLVVNPAAGKSDALITMDDIRGVIESGMEDVKSIISNYLRLN